MNNENYDISEQRRRKAEQFKLSISDDFYDGSPQREETEPAELNSYSGQDVREQMARDSKHALKQKKKEKKRELKEKNRRNKRAFRIMWLISVTVVGIMAGIYIVTGMNDMLAIKRTDATTVQINIPENPSLDAVADALVKNGIISETSYFKIFATVTKAGDFDQGTYEMRKNMDYQAIINYLHSSANRTDTVSATITEGESVLEIAKTLENAGALGDKDKFLELCASDNFDEDFDFLQSITNGNDRYYKLEGYLYPDTYEFYVNEDPEHIIYRFLNNYESKITQKMEVEGYKKKVSVKKMLEESDLGYTLDEIMTIASIIQAEAADEEDMYYISSVLHNRLEADAEKGVSKLGLDSTKYYPYRSASDVPESMREGYVSNYDTYEKEGLPAGPICNPGMAAIKAALDPKNTGYYFFCHDSKGNAYYATTMYEQNANLEYIENNDL